MCTCYNLRAKPGEDRLEMAIKIILVARAGYLCRKDILELRMRHSEWIESVIPFSTANGYYPSVERDAENDLLALLVSSPGALLLRKPHNTLYRETMKTVEEDLKVRLSFDWVLPTPPSERKVAMVGGRSMFDAKNKGFCYRGAYEAAEALGISVVVVDRPGYWLQDEAYSQLRSDFVSIDMIIDEGLPSRIADAVKDLEIDGIDSFADELVGATAQAAERLGLPTDPVSAYMRALDKHETSKLFNTTIQILLLDNAGLLDDPSMLPQLESLRYPLIIKPCRGGGSRGVMKANSWASLRQAARQVEDWGYSKQGILIETYVDGPEVDANFALWEGEILFFEICDDFPCDADAEDATTSDTFAEDNMVMPSRLPREERDLVRSSLHNSLLQLGFRSGVFHVEARIQNSTMRYQDTNGIVDLESADGISEGAGNRRQPEVFLVEVNPRPADFDNIYGIAYTYGVDFNSLHWLRALDDGARFTALCHPFTCGTQYYSCILVIPIHRENVFVPENYCTEILRRLPEVAPYVSGTECFTAGKRVSPVGGAGHIGSFLVYSKKSRRNLLEMCMYIKKVFRDILDNI